MDGLGRFSPLIAAAVSTAGAVNEAVAKTETVFLHVPLSMLYVAIGGALIGVFLLPNKDAAKVSTAPESGAGVARRLLWLALNAGALAAAVLGYAYMAAWTVQALLALAPLLALPFNLDQDKVALLLEKAMMPITGITGAFIRPLLPAYLRGAEALTARLLGRVAP